MKTLALTYEKVNTVCVYLLMNVSNCFVDGVMIPSERICSWTLKKSINFIHSCTDCTVTVEFSGSCSLRLLLLPPVSDFSSLSSRCGPAHTDPALVLSPLSQILHGQSGAEGSGLMLSFRCRVGTNRESKAEQSEDGWGWWRVHSGGIILPVLFFIPWNFTW